VRNKADIGYSRSSPAQRLEHFFHAPDELREMLNKAGFAQVEVQTVVQQIGFFFRNRLP